MKLSNVDWVLPLLLEVQKGKTLQVFRDGFWIDCDRQASDLSFKHPKDTYRIKPEVKLRPWRPEEVPVGAWIKNKNNESKDIFYTQILGWDNGYIYCGPYGDERFRNQSPVGALCEWLHSQDRGKTWHSCGVEV